MAITGTTELFLCYPVKSLEHTWSSGARKFHLQVPDLSMSCNDLTVKLCLSTRKVVPKIPTRLFLIPLQRKICSIVYLLFLLIQEFPICQLDKFESGYSSVSLCKHATACQNRAGIDLMQRSTTGPVLAHYDIDGDVQERRNSSALAMQLRFFLHQPIDMLEA